MIQITDLTIRYPSVLAVDHISCTFDPNLIYGIVGPNGAGKTTLIQALVGLIGEFDGEILFNGKSATHNRHLIKTQLGFAPEDTSLFPYLTAREYLQFLADLKAIDQPENQIEMLTDKLGMDDFADEIVDRYSHGMRKKLSLAGALLGHPAWLILDEALNGLDPVTMHNVRQLLKQRAESGMTILLTSHVLQLVEDWCDVIMVLNKGRIAGQFSRESIASWKAKSGKSFSDYFISLIAGAEDQNLR